MFNLLYSQNNMFWTLYWSYFLAQQENGLFEKLQIFILDWEEYNPLSCQCFSFFFFYSDVIIFLKMHRGLVTQHKNTLFFEYLFILNQPHIVKLRFTSLKLLLFIFPKHRKSIYYCFQIIHAPSKKAEKFIGVISHPE